MFWIGIKGSGIFCIKKYILDNSMFMLFDWIILYNSVLVDNFVYCFVFGCKDKLWIGIENGINYYLYLSR